MSDRNYGVVAPEAAMSLGGLELLKGIINGTQPHPPISELLGFHLAEVEHGRAVFESVPEFRQYNPIGTVHGGIAATLLDSALGCAIFSTLAKGEAWTTLELKVNFVRAIYQRHRADARRRPPHPQGANRCNFGGRPEGSCRQALRTRHDDVHDLSGQSLKA